jgi:hypothetical protein
MIKIDTLMENHQNLYPPEPGTTTEVDNVIAQLQQACNEPPEPIQPQPSTNKGRFARGNKANAKGNNQFKKDGKPVVPEDFLEDGKLPSTIAIARDNRGRIVDSAGAKALQQSAYKLQLKQALKQMLPASEVAELMICHARQQDDKRLSQEAIRDILDRTIGKPQANTLHRYKGQHTEVQVNLTALPASEQEQYLALSAKLLASEVGEAGGKEPIEGELIEPSAL